MHKFLVVLAIAGGCSDSGTATGDPVELTGLAASLSKASCSKSFECCTATEIMAEYGAMVTTEANCESQIGGLLSSLLVPSYQASVTAGRLEYDAAAAGDCVAAIESLTCAQYSGQAMTASGCNTFLVPKVANGGACSQSYECTSGNCEGASAGTPPTDGMCKVKPTVGQTCSLSCADGSYCQGTTCVALQANGATCSDSSHCSSGYCNTTCMTAPVTCDGL